MNEKSKIEELENRLRTLQHQQQRFSDELVFIQRELYKLRGENAQEVRTEKVAPSIKVAINESVVPSKPRIQIISSISNQKLEDFIGTNLASKVGILITIIGIFIGTKYAIDKELISPLMRILLGYLAGATLIFTAIKLKAKYLNFSAVLMGGGLAVIYFITYISYSFYQLFPQAITFVFMVMITIVAVAIALWYDQKIIAILGQVAAYAIPFLLSDGSGKVVVLFTYVAIINVGLIYLSFKKDWKILYHLAFFLTWIISTTALVAGAVKTTSFSTNLLFLSINFFTFYVTSLSYKIVRRELYNLSEVAIVILNAVVYFFLGAYLINENFDSTRYLTVFALASAAVHFIVGFIIYRLKLADETTYQFLIGLGLLFVTVAIPVELNGSWVTLLWTVEATVLTYIATKNSRSLFLKIAAPMIFIAVASLLHDWVNAYPSFGDFFFDEKLIRQPFINLTFIFSLIVCGCFAYIHFKTYRAQLGKGFVFTFFKKWLPLFFWLMLYFTCFNEIHYTWHLQFDVSANNNQPAVHYRVLSLIIYTLLFVTALLKFNGRKIKVRSVDDRLLIGGIFITLFFLTKGLFTIGELRDIYIAQSKNNDPSFWMLGIRYLCFIAFAIFYFAEWRAVRRIATPNSTKIFALVFSVTLLTIICNEFVHWMDVAGYQNQYKLGLSIIFGLYALILIFIGIIKKHQHLRVAAIALFVLTLLKFFLYDLSSLSTISKTIVLVVLGIILLIVSFLYNKYKGVILGDD